MRAIHPGLRVTQARTMAGVRVAAALLRPGLAVPGMAVPGLDGTGTGTQFIYIGHIAVFYLDYLDTFTQKTLSVVPGGSYAMTPVNSRGG